MLQPGSQPRYHLCFSRSWKAGREVRKVCLEKAKLQVYPEERLLDTGSCRWAERLFLAGPGLDLEGKGLEKLLVSNQVQVSWDQLF